MAKADSIPIIKVLFTLHAGMDALDFVGPLEVLTKAKHNINDDCKSSVQKDEIQFLELHLPIFHHPHKSCIPHPASSSLKLT